MSSQFLFTYGTLKSDQPEHAAHCAPPRSIRKAQARGALWRLREGYPILQVDPKLALLDATRDCVADWREANQRAASASAPTLDDGRWIQGELFELPLEPDVLQKMDTWENFVPGIKSAYQRRVIWTRDEQGRDQVAWAYVCYSPPNWATLLDTDRYNAT